MFCRYIVALVAVLLASCRESPIDGSWRMAHWTQLDRTQDNYFVNITNHLTSTVRNDHFQRAHQTTARIAHRV